MSTLPTTRNHSLLTDVVAAMVLAPFLSQAAEKETPLLDEWLHAKYPESQPWDIGAEIRGRYEDKEDAGVVANTDFISGTAVSREATYLREKIHLGYKASPWVSAFVEGRDASANDDPSAEDSLDLFQAYMIFGNAKEFPLTAQIGRQEMAYGDQRLIGKGDWSNTGRSFDAIKLRLENSFGWVDAFTSKVVLVDDGNFNVDNDYDYFSGIYASTKKLMPWQETQAYFLARNSRPQAPNAISTGVPGSPSTQRDIYTLGTLWKSDPEAFGGWDYSMELDYQFGSVYNKTQLDRLDQQSYGVFLDAGYTWKSSCGTPRLGVGYEHGSGDSNPNDGKVETFENLFGTQHRPYGLMDLVGARNMHIPKLEFTIKPVKGLTLGADYLFFILDDTNDLFYPESGSGRSGNGYGINPGNNSFVGSEIDLYANYGINKWANYQIGYGHFFTSDYIDQSVGSAATDADWFYTQLILTF
ncbi:MAG: alginate export family protein [Luteolibacter sp.]|uniref:alginate export family protein n=1 Tax=Luteolibacter sp. TaxID=1962973 RepID=UPI003264D1C4